MNMLSHWNPFRSISRYNPAFEDLFRDFAMRPVSAELDAAPDIRIDVSEDEKSYRVKADIPGVKKDDIRISIEGNEVSISAELKRESEQKKDDRLIHSERSYGRAYRAFTLPLAVDPNAASARYDNGVLALMLPKKQNGGSRRIEVG